MLVINEIMFFIFLVSIESTGAIKAEDLMRESIKILMEKTEVLLNEITSKKN